VTGGCPGVGGPRSWRVRSPCPMRPRRPPTGRLGASQPGHRAGRASSTEGICASQALTSRGLWTILSRLRSIFMQPRSIGGESSMVGPSPPFFYLRAINAPVLMCARAHSVSPAHRAAWLIAPRLLCLKYPARKSLPPLHYRCPVTGKPRCEYCGQTLDRNAGKNNSYEADHRIPRSRGGDSTPVNLAPSCRTCNRSKGAKKPEEWTPKRVE
jgi:hypothetical protein